MLNRPVTPTPSNYCYILGNLKGYAQTDGIAAYDGDEYMSFRQLWERSEALAQWLLREYPEKNPVAIYGDKENDMLVCMVAAIKSGRPYICLPSFYPEGKINDILEDSKPDVILHLAAQSIHAVSVPVLWKTELRAIADTPCDTEVSPNSYVGVDDVVCILYTSGSTGRPKGVLLTRRNCEAMSEYYRSTVERSLLRDGERIVNFSSYSFSASLYTIYYALMRLGNSVYGISRNKMEDLQELVERLVRMNPHNICCTAALMDRLQHHSKFCAKYMTNLDFVFLGGDAIHPDTVRELWRRFPGVRVTSNYGLTEDTATGNNCDLTEALLSKGERYLPAGTMPNCRLYLIDEDGKRITKDDCPGELIVCNDAVSPGYLNRPEQTSAVFFVNEHGRWSYHTRDLMKIKDGYLYFLGRLDNQVKVGGNRFELEDVEAHLRRVENVRDCVVCVQTLENKVSVLAALVVRQDSSMSNMKSIMQIKQALAQEVESYMIPAKIFFVDAVPKNVNLKIDRMAAKRIIENLTEQRG